jgi:hypothetical protein
MLHLIDFSFIILVSVVLFLFWIRRFIDIRKQYKIFRRQYVYVVVIEWRTLFSSRNEDSLPRRKKRYFLY